MKAKELADLLIQHGDTEVHIVIDPVDGFPDDSRFYSDEIIDILISQPGEPVILFAEGVLSKAVGV